MKKITALLLATALAFNVSSAFAIGAIAVDDQEGDADPGYGIATGHDTEAEAKAAAEALGATTRVILDLPNRRLFDSFEARVLLAKEFRKYRPRIVIGFGDKTPMASPDHWQAMLITDAAVFYSRLSKWEQYFDSLPVHNISAQLYFRLAFEPQSLGGFLSHFTVDITDTLEAKIAAVRCYASQFPATKEHVFDRIRGAALIAGSASGFHAGETFVSTRQLGVKDLVKTVLP